MEISYSPYTLNPLKRLNRSSTMEPKPGVFLRAKLGDQVTYADYFPHASFGDKGCEHFLNDFKYQNDRYEKKVLHLLLKDKEYQNHLPKKFYNHQIWTGSEDLEAPVVEYRLTKHDDRTFLDPLKRGLRLRLDAKALFNRQSFQEFLSTIPVELLSLIDYVEDPIIETNWSELGIKAASDLLKGSPHDFYIYRPNSEFYPQHETKIVFSSYLGSDLGRWHAYCELTDSGDLTEFHGVLSRGFFKEEVCFFEGTYQDGFSVDINVVNSIYQDLSKREWKPLCTL